MLALYRSGRQHDALAAYRRARVTLVEELGIEPGRQLKELEAAVLEQDPALDLAAPGTSRFGLPTLLESVGPAFVGREADLARLRSAWLDAADGRGGFVSVLGPEGIGKSRLVAELAREVQRAGGVVVYGRCGEGGSGVRALLDDVLRGTAASVDALVEEPPAERGAAIVQLLAAQFVGRAVLLVVDDAHLADQDTVELLADVAGWSAAGALLVVATFRTDAEMSAVPLPTASDVGAQVVLHGLDRASLQRVCDMYAVAPWWPDDIDRLEELSGGVPLRVHELASEWARERAIRGVAAAADRSAAAQIRLAGLRAEISQSVEGIQLVLEQRRVNVGPRHRSSSHEAHGGGGECPYKGLATFDTADAAMFFGRERLVAELIARLAGTQLLAVVGPSGSGKSSVVRAGLVPALVSGVLPVAGGWRAVVETPSTWRRDRHRTGDERAAGRQLLVVDQLEELFVGALGREDQQDYVERIVAAAGQPDRCVVVVVRADQLDRCIGFEELGALMNGNDVLIGPMNDIELRRAIERPAQRGGCTFEPGLVDRIVGDVAGRPGALPLLSTALAETWARSDDGVLTLRAYEAAGGVNDAMATLAEEAFAALDPQAKLASRRLLMRLSEVNASGASDMRRRVPLEELEAGEPSRLALAAFVERRLLVVDRDSVEVAHEALLREWPRLRSWMDDDYQGRRLQRRLSDAARAWQATADASELYRGTRLDSALDWAAGHGADVTPHEQAFLDASAHAAARELEDARRRAADKARDNRRLRRSLIGLAALLVVAITAGLLFVIQREQAEGNAREARARALASEAAGAIGEDPELAMLLGLEAVGATEEPLASAVSALHAATQSSRLEYRRPEATAQVDVNPDGTRIVTLAVADRGIALVWDAASGDLVATLPAPGPDLVAEDVRFHPDGTTVAVAYSNEVDGPAPAVVLWDSTSAQVKRVLTGTDDVYCCVDVSTDGQRLVTGNADDSGEHVTIWDVATGAQAVSIQLPSVGEARFLPDGTAVVVGEVTSERVGIYSTSDGTLLRTIPTPGFVPVTVALNAPTDWLALGSQQSREVRIIDFETGRLHRRIPGSDIGPVDWSPDGTRLSIAGSNQAAIRIFDVAAGTDPLVLVGHESGSWDAEFIGAGDRLASVGQYGELRVWDVSPDGPPALGAITPESGSAWTINFAPDGTEVFLGTSGQTIERLSVETGARLAARDTQLVGLLPFWAPVSPDGRFTASTNVIDGASSVLDSQTLDPIATLPACTAPNGFSSEGTLLALDGRQLCVPGFSTVLFEAPAGAELRSRIIEVSSGREVLDLGEVDIHGAVFNPEGLFPADRYVAVGAEFARLDLYDLVEGRLIGSLPVEGGLIKFTFDTTGRWLVVTTGQGRVWVLDMAAVVEGSAPEDAITHDFEAHDGSITGVDVSVDGTLATVGLGEEVRLWNLETGALIVELPTHPPAGLGTLEFSPDGSYLLYTDGKVLRRYDLDVDDLVRLARSLVTRDLTREECATFVIDDCP
jgi:WD40 repeat protein